MLGHQLFLFPWFRDAKGSMSAPESMLIGRQAGFLHTISSQQCKIVTVCPQSLSLLLCDVWQVSFQVLQLMLWN